MQAVNLLPTDFTASGRSSGRPEAPSPRKPLPVGALAVLGILAAVVIAVVLVSLSGNRVRDRESRLAAVKVEEQVVAKQAALLAPYGAFRQLAADRVSTVRQLADSRFDWEQTLRDLSRVIPADVTLSNLTGTVAPGARAGTGSSSNNLRPSRAVPAVEISGCASDQDSVARLMARLRGVRGVTRVALASSAKEKEQTTEASGSSSAAPAGCGRGSKPLFEVVMFFEAATATAATPADGTAAPSASATPAPSGSATPAPSSTPGASATPAPSPSPAPTPGPSGATTETDGTK